MRLVGLWNTIRVKFLPVLVGLIVNQPILAQTTPLVWTPDTIPVQDDLLSTFFILDRLSILNDNQLIYSKRIGKTYNETDVLNMVNDALKSSGIRLEKNQWVQIDRLIPKDQANHFDLVLSIQPQNLTESPSNSVTKSQITGVVGLVPNDKGTLHLIGDINLWMPKLRVTGQELLFSYKRTSSNYSSANLMYTHPVIMDKWFIESGLLVEQRDSLYQKMDVHIGQRLQLQNDFYITSGIAWESLQSTGDSNIPLANNQAFSLYGGFDWAKSSFTRRNKSNFVQLPNLELQSSRQGFQSSLSSLIYAKHQKSMSINQTDSETGLDGLYEQWVFTIRADWGMLYRASSPGYGFLLQSFHWNQAQELLWSDISVFGGANSLAGFYERQFSARSVYVVKTGYGYIINANNLWELFVSGGFYDRYDPISQSPTESSLVSVGISYRFETDFGRIQVSLANPIGGSHQGAKVHLLSGW